MSDYIETVEHRAAVYSLGAPDNDLLRENRKEEFLAWLERHDRAVRAEAWDEGYVAGSLHGLGPLALDNPYRTESQ